MERIILIKYGELTTKKENRKVFIKCLVTNIKSLLGDYDLNIKYDRVRMYITCLDEYVDEVALKLSKIFGIHGVVICYKTTSDIKDIENKVIDILKNETFNTFKVDTRRADKNFIMNSMEFDKYIGNTVLENFNCKVDVHNPDLKVYIEIRPEGTYVYVGEIKGLGGYPSGVQGKGLLMLSGGIDSPVAGYLALKRGINVECLYFESPPHTSVQAKNKVIKLSSIINQYSGNVKIHIVPFTDIQEAIYKNCPSDYNITIMRRMMYRIAERYSKKIKSKILINGESVGQVASQTITSMSVINEVTSMPVIRPVACMDKLEIIDISKKIGTYDTSILPYEDCCTIFLPKHPVINPRLDRCMAYEKTFDYENLIEETINNIKVLKNLNINSHEELL